MNENKLNYMLDEIFAIFGRVRPSFNSPIYNSVKRRIDNKNILDEAVGYIVRKFENYDSLPSNLGKHIEKEFAEWTSKNPDKKEKIKKCNLCSQGLIGFFFAFDSTGHRFVCKCTCNSEAQHENLKAYTLQEVQKLGWLYSFSGNTGADEFWAQQYENFKRGLEYRKPSGNWDGVIGNCDKPRHDPWEEMA